VAKILVADDNSNVQKTVALALADLGVEVVAVNNGEAAVRKLADFSPDLVLADIFMPVRNGYEVCDYVKKDSKFSKVPVVLLVGAFDPLDEREAQRVGADGVLKKPFVPPDPLITMVKTLLERVLGERLTAVAATPGAKTGNMEVATAPAPPTRSAQKPEPAYEEEPEPVVQTRLRSVAFETSDRPVAFGQLMETSAAESSPAAGVIEPVDNEQILTSQRDATLGDPVFWKSEPPDPESEAAPADEDPASLDMHDWHQGEDSLPLRNEALPLPATEPLELVHEDVLSKTDEIELTPVSAKSELLELDQASQASLTVTPGKADDLAANPLDWLANAPAVPPKLADDIAPLPGGIEETPSNPAQQSQHAAVEKPVSSAVAAPPAAEISSLAPDEPVRVPVRSSAVPEPSALAARPEKPASSDPAKTQPSIPKTPAVAEATIPSMPKADWGDLTEVLKTTGLSASLHEAVLASSGMPASGPAAGGTTPPPAQPHAPGSEDAMVQANAQKPAPDPALVEAVVQRVLDKMRPQVVEIVTKEFLRPIVQALVQREISKH
jgi:CheY-like chemotaxis protein